ncbi:hypothetical protein Forpi1262_v000238 [Fusarium oxysporum f. sp. raphani]|uniref:Uncharacterized protein n=1 Tax=Fusarium oxysporum f. sp. raphani TaxID=96318 RepID=A0A8J5URQ7_FUSOX|nr:hypothetical protein Forpi1262_v000238 [Fusarium oxysporum f. sp. raphani]
MSTTLKSHNVPLSLPDGLSEEQLTSFKPFTNWVNTLTNSLRLQSDESHPFHKDPYSLRSVTIQSYDLFGVKRIGFIKLTATVSNDSGETLPAAALLRGPSVAMLFMLIPPTFPPRPQSATSSSQSNPAFPPAVLASLNYQRVWSTTRVASPEQQRKK